MVFKKLVVLLAAISLSMACQTQEEKEAEEFLEELEDWEEMPDSVCPTDFAACVEFFMAITPIVAQCDGFTVDPGLEERVNSLCTEMQCDNTLDGVPESYIDNCIAYFSTCASFEEDLAPYECNYIMTTCVDPDADTDSDIDTE